MENKELKERFIDERTGIEYVRQGDYYIPNLVLPKQKKIHLNKYGRMRLNYLKEHKKAEYTIMLMENMLYWVGTMKSIKNQAEEIVLKEIIYQ